MADRATSQRFDDTERDDILQLVGFKLEDEMFGVDILMVQEIIRSAPVTPVPNSPDFVDGVINLRGAIIPVIDLRRRLLVTKSTEEANKDWIIILDIDSRITGFIVDEVTEVLKIEESMIEAAPEIVGAGMETQYIQGVCDIGKNLIILLDFNRILRVDEIRKLKDLDGGV